MTKVCAYFPDFLPIVMRRLNGNFDVEDARVLMKKQWLLDADQLGDRVRSFPEALTLVLPEAVVEFLQPTQSAQAER